MSGDHRAALQRATLALIANVNQIHRAGAGLLPLSQLCALNGFNANLAQLEQREPVQLRAGAENSGTFLNRGQSLTFNAAGLAIEVPEKLEGEYCLDENRLELRFHPQATIVGKKLFVKATLLSVSGDEHGIEVQVQGPIPLPTTKISFDQ